MSPTPPDHPTRLPSHRIETFRLIIRSGVPSDAPAIAALLSAPENNPFTPPDTGAVEEYLGRLERWASKRAEGNFSFMVVTLRDGTVIGFAGFNEFRWGKPLDPSSYDLSTAVTEIATDGGDGKEKSDETEEPGPKFLEADIGVMIDHRHWRQGYAREVVAAEVEYAFNVFGADSIACDTQLENEPWRALIRSMGLGSSETFRIGGRFGDDWIYRFGRPLWREATESMKGDGTWPL